MLTGHDVISINRKNMDYFTYVPKGTTFAAITNNPFWVSAEHGRSRVMPLVFRKNFKAKEIIDKTELEEKLYEEKDKFLQWCVDYRYWLNKTCNGHLLNGSQLVMCCDKDLQQVNTGDFDEVILFKKMCETELLKGKPFCNWNDYEETDDDAEAYRPLFDSLFVKTTDENDTITTDEMRKEIEQYIAVHNEYLDCFDLNKVIGENKQVEYKIKFIGNNAKWRHWNDFLTTKLELTKKRVPNGIVWQNVKISSSITNQLFNQQPANMNSVNSVCLP